jgi:GNAT superfamily N-acetyltransferase
MSVRENELLDPARVQPHHYEEMLSRRGRGGVAEIDRRLVDFAIVDLQERDIWALFVEPALERRGIGRQLHQVMLDWTFGTGVEQVSLARSVATRAESFYTAAGWRLVRRAEDGDARFEMKREPWLTRQTRQAGQTR